MWPCQSSLADQRHVHGVNKSCMSTGGVPECIAVGKRGIWAPSSTFFCMAQSCFPERVCVCETKAGFFSLSSCNPTTYVSVSLEEGGQVCSIEAATLCRNFVFPVPIATGRCVCGLDECVWSQSLRNGGFIPTSCQLSR